MAIQRALSEGGLSGNREFVGHGMGKQMHEMPQIPSFAPENGTKGPVLRPGQILSIQVIAHEGSPVVRVSGDGWGVLTGDGKRALQFSQMVILQRHTTEILTRARS